MKTIVIMMIALYLCMHDHEILGFILLLLSTIDDNEE